MPALSEVSSNQHRRMVQTPKSGYRQLPHDKLLDENSSNGYQARGGTSPREGLNPQRATPKSRLPVLASTPTPTSISVSSNVLSGRKWATGLAAKAGKRNPDVSTIKTEDSRKSQRLFQSPLKASGYFTPPSKRVVSPAAKPLPSPPMARLGGPSLGKESRSLIDATEKPLRHSPGTPEEKEWPTLYPLMSPNRTSPIDARAHGVGGSTAISENASPTLVTARCSAILDHRNISEKHGLSPRVAKEREVKRQDQPETASLYLGKVKAPRRIDRKPEVKPIAKPVASELSKSPSGISIGKAITCHEAISYDCREKTPPYGSAECVRTPAAVAGFEGTVMLQLEGAEGSTERTQSPITSFSRPRSPTCVVNAEDLNSTTIDTMEPSPSLLTAGHKQSGSNKLHSGNVSQDVFNSSKPNIERYCVISVRSASKLPRLGQAASNVTIQNNPVPSLGSESGPPPRHKPLFALQPQKSRIECEFHEEDRGAWSGHIPSTEEVRSLVPSLHHTECSNSGLEVPQSLESSGGAVEPYGRGDAPREHEKRIKRLSFNAHGPDLGPILTISHDAEAVIMGGDVETGLFKSTNISTKVRRMSQDIYRSAIQNGMRKNRYDEGPKGFSNEGSGSSAAFSSIVKSELCGGVSASLGHQGGHDAGTLSDVADVKPENVNPVLHAQNTDAKIQQSEDKHTVYGMSRAGVLPVTEWYEKQPATIDGMNDQSDERSIAPLTNTPIRKSGDSARDSVGPRDNITAGTNDNDAVPGFLIHHKKPTTTPTSPALTPLLTGLLPKDSVHHASTGKTPAAQVVEASTSIHRPALPPKESLSTEHRTRISRDNSFARMEYSRQPSRRASGDVTSKYNPDSQSCNAEHYTGGAYTLDDSTTRSNRRRPAKSNVGLVAGNGKVKTLESRNSRSKETAGQDMKAHRSPSRTRLAIAKLGDFFHKRSKNDVKALENGATDKEDKAGGTRNPLPPFRFPTGLPHPHYQTTRPPTIKRGTRSSPSQRTSHSFTAGKDRNSFSPSTRHANRVSEATAMAMAIMEKARCENDSPEKDKLVSLAAVMVDAITNARDAQRYMHQAQQAARDARLSYDLTQRGIAEIGRLVRESGPAMDLSIFSKLHSD